MLAYLLSSVSIDFIDIRHFPLERRHIDYEEVILGLLSRRGAGFAGARRPGHDVVNGEPGRHRRRGIHLPGRRSDRLEPGAHAELRQALPGVSLVQVIQVSGEEAVGEAVLGEAVEVAPQVDALLLDTGSRTGAAVKELGGTGRTHDWSVSRRIREAVDVPVFLAGGLREENVAEAVGIVRPFAVDVCSGVRTEGKLDEIKLAGFFERVNHQT